MQTSQPPVLSTIEEIKVQHKPIYRKPETSQLLEEAAMIQGGADSVL